MKINTKILRESLTYAGATVAYVLLISLFLFNGKHLFGEKDNFLMPMFMLLLLIVSAATTGSLVFGKPILMYWDGEKREAVELLATNIILLAAVIVLLAVIMIIVAV